MESMEFEDILLDVGEYGKFQRNLVMFFLYPAAALMPLLGAVILFYMSVPDHWCYVPELDSFNLTIDEKKRLIGPPSDLQCSMYDIDYYTLLNSSFSNFSIPNGTETRPCVNGWQYDKTYFESTVASQWNLVCKDDHYVSLILTLTSVGNMIGTAMFGALADRVGRKPAFFATVILGFVASIISVHMTNLAAFTFFRIMNNTVLPSIFQLPYIAVLELVGPTKRARMNGITNIGWTVGLCFLSLVAWLSGGWLTLGRIASCLPFLLLLYWKMLPESPRWLLSRERYSDAADVLGKIAATNGIRIERDVLLAKLKEVGERVKKEKAKELVDTDESSPKVILKSPKLKKYFLVLTFCFSANIMSYDGLQLNATNLEGNPFLNFFLLSVAEAPGFLFSWWFMEVIGRRWCSVSALIFTGLSCLPTVFYPKSEVVSSFLGKFGSAASYMAMYQQSSEIYPTAIRSLALGLSTSISLFTLFIVPYVVYLRVFGHYIPFLIIAITCISAGLAALILPETQNESLPQSVHDAEQFGEGQRILSLYRRRRPSCYVKREDSIRRNSQAQATKI